MLDNAYKYMYAKNMVRKISLYLKNKTKGDFVMKTNTNKRLRLTAKLVALCMIVVLLGGGVGISSGAGGRVPAAISFEDFVGTFSGFGDPFGIAAEINAEMMANSPAALATQSVESSSPLWQGGRENEYILYGGALYAAILRGEVAIDAQTQVQLDALETLFAQGVRNVERWLEDTTVDLTGYEDVMYRVCLETNTSGYVRINEDVGVLEIEVTFVPNAPEVVVLRQALLVPYVVAGRSEQVATMSTPANNFPRHLVTADQLTRHPFRSVGLLRFRVNGNSYGGSAFLICDLFALTAAHNILLHGVTSTNFTLTVPLRQHSVSHAWMPTQWTQREDFQYDKAILRFTRGAFAGAGNLQLGTSNAGTIPSAGFVRIIGFPGATSPSYPGRMVHSSGTVYSVDRNLFTSSIFSHGGMSGGAVVSSVDNRVLGIHIAGTTTQPGNVRRAVAIRILPSFVTRINTTRNAILNPRPPQT